MQAIKSYVVDLTKISGGGEIKCPECCNEIAPDDETEDAYTILETVMKGDCLERIVLRCNKCGSQVHLTGFKALEKAI